MTSWVVRYEGATHAVLRHVDDFGLPSVDLVGLPRRCVESDDKVPLFRSTIDARHVEDVPNPTQALLTARSDDSWISISAKTQGRLHAALLIGEDPHRRLDARQAAALMHQMSLVHHVVTSENLRRVLIADEVGLGKTIEAGMIVNRILEERPTARVLYLAPARLVRNVAGEFLSKLSLDARKWVAGSDIDARLESDKVVIASIHRAVHSENLEKVASSGSWDVIIVDECHHLSDWDEGGGKPNRGFKLVELLASRLPHDGRLVLLSGTPHQGSIARFGNLLRLLSDDQKDHRQAAGRVIYRTKERVSDWDGRPLFPRRLIRATTVISLGEEFHAWYQMISELYERDGLTGSAARAAGWAKGQALQWASSSIEAGVGFLVRLAIRRLNWKVDHPSLQRAMQALRPYRGGPANEPLESLYERLRKQIGAQQLVGESDDAEDLDDFDEVWRPNPSALASVLDSGVRLLQGGIGGSKWEALKPLINEANGEKVVLFAQPVETVSVVARYLERLSGQFPAIIVGNQSDQERTDEITRFRRHDGPQFLVSSRAGGEGLNLQAARRLVHLDIPWNPMEMEQRVGRVHRFGSRKTIIVDTLVVQGTREIDMYRIAREKLRMIATHLDPEQFETLFSRVMSLVPPKELESIMGAGPTERLDDRTAELIGQLVTAGFQTWQAFDSKYRDEAKKIDQLASGEATWGDVSEFVTKHVGGRPAPDVRLTGFQFEGEEVVTTEDMVPAIRMDEQVFVCADTRGVPAEMLDGTVVPTLGLNHVRVRQKLADLLGDGGSGAAYVRRPSDLGPGLPTMFAALVMLRQCIRVGGIGVVEKDVKLEVFVVSEDGQSRRLESSERARLVRGLIGAARVKEPRMMEWINTLQEIEANLAAKIRLPTDAERSEGVRAAVWPIAAFVVGQT